MRMVVEMREYRVLHVGRDIGRLVPLNGGHQPRFYVPDKVLHKYLRPGAPYAKFYPKTFDEWVHVFDKKFAQFDIKKVRRCRVL